MDPRDGARCQVSRDDPRRHPPSFLTNPPKFRAEMMVNSSTRSPRCRGLEFTGVDISQLFLSWKKCSDNRPPLMLVTTPEPYVIEETTRSKTKVNNWLFFLPSDRPLRPRRAGRFSPSKEPEWRPEGSLTRRSCPGLGGFRDSPPPLDLPRSNPKP